MRILLFSPRFAPDIGGVATSANRLAAHLVALGHEVDVWLETRALPPGVEHHEHFHAQLMVTRIGAFASEDLQQQFLYSAIEDRQQHKRWDLIWGHYLLPQGFNAVFLGKLLGIASVVGARGNDVDRELCAGGDFSRLNYVLQQATAVTSVSHELARKMNAIQTDATIQVIHNSVYTKQFQPLEKDPTLASEIGLDGYAVIGFSGELRYKKGAPILLQAYASIASERPCKLLIIGEARARDQEHLDRFRISHPELADGVIITGHIEPDAVAKHLACCDVIALPSLWDGLPNALLEAMACARPIVAARSGGIPEVLTGDGDGILLARDELARLDEAIRALLDAPAELLQSMGAAARKRVQACCQPTQERATIAAVLQSCVEKQVCD